MTFEQLFSILRARWLIALGVFIAVVSTTAAITWLMPRTYTATASVLVDIKSADAITGGVSPGVMAPSYLMTQIDVITSMRVAQRVVSKLRLTDVPSLRAKWKETTHSTGSFEGYVAQLIRGGLEARPSRGSNVINLQYQAADPAFAATIVNGFVGAYLDITMELRTDPAKQYGTFFDGNARKLRERLKEAQSALSVFQQDNGLVVNDERLDVETARLNELSQNYVSQQAAVADSESRRNIVNAQGRNTQEVMGNPLVASLKSDIVRLESQLGQLSTKMGDNHPQVIELRTNLEQMRAKLDAEVSRVTTSVTLNNSVNVHRASQIKSSLEEQRAKVLKMKQQRDQASMLVRDVENAQRAYEGVMSRLNLTALESQAMLSNVAALEYAPVPSIPTSPRLMINMALGLLVGGMLALGTALAVERFDRRLRTFNEAEQLLSLPVVAVIPGFKKKAGQGGAEPSVPARFLLGATKIKAIAQ